MQCSLAMGAEENPGPPRASGERIEFPGPSVSGIFLPPRDNIRVQPINRHGLSGTSQRTRVPPCAAGAMLSRPPMMPAR